MTWSEDAATIRYKGALGQRRRDYEAAVEEMRASLEALAVHTSICPPSGTDHQARRQRIEWYRGLTQVRRRAHKALQTYEELINSPPPKLGQPQ